MNPAVSVIVPSFNHRMFLEQRMDSILAQTFQDFEVILLDDASTDGSGDWLKGISRHPKVTSLEINKTNSGSPFQQWARGLRKARGEFVWIAESDDWAHPEFLGRSLDVLQNHLGVGMVNHNSHLVDQEGEIVGATNYRFHIAPTEEWDGMSRYEGKTFLKKFMLHQSAVYNASGVVFRKQACAGFEEYARLKQAGDTLFWTNILTKWDIVVGDEPLNKFRQHEAFATIPSFIALSFLIQPHRQVKQKPEHPWIAKLRAVRISLGLPPVLTSKKAHSTSPTSKAGPAKPRFEDADWSISSPRIDVLKRGIVGWNDVNRHMFVPASWGYKTVPFPHDNWYQWQAELNTAGYDIGKATMVHANDREGGKDWPLYAASMVGWKRLTQWEQAILHCFDAQVPGDFVETGVWRGGVLILAAALLEEHREATRLVWGFDSFDGLPPPDPKHYPGDAAVKDLSKFQELKVSQQEVLANFDAWGVSTEQVRLVKGLFKDTLHKAEVEQIAVLRLDGDYYESTIQSLEALEPRVAENGVIIIDDYHAFPECRQAVEDYRTRNGITFPIHEIDGIGVFWYKSMTPDSEGKRFRQLARQEIFSQQSKWMADLAERRAQVNAHLFQQKTGPQRYDWINAVIEKRGATAYLEIGVRNPADCFDRVLAPEKTSVDPGVEFEANPVDFPLTSDAFFEQLESGKLEGFQPDHKWDLIFIDGLHRAAQVDRDINNAMKHLRPGGMIVLHDCLPLNEHFAQDAYPGKDNLEHKMAWNGSTWRAFYKHWLEGQTFAYVIAHDWGIGVIDSSKSRRPISLEGEWGLASLADYKKALEEAGCILTFEAALEQL